MGGTSARTTDARGRHGHRPGHCTCRKTSGYNAVSRLHLTVGSRWRKHTRAQPRNPGGFPVAPAYRRRMDASEIRWNEQARAKILDDSDRVLREAVLEIARSGDGISSDEAFAQLNARLKDRFIDYEPGPDIRRYADAIAAGDVADAS